MASISANGSKGHHKFTLTVTETSTSETNNTSTISYNFQISPIKIPSSAANAWDWESYTRPDCTVSYKFVINGTAYESTIPEYDAMSAKTLKSGTQTVTHNTDGTKTLSFSFVVTDTTGVNYTSGNASANGTLALTAIEIEKPSTGTPPQITASVVDTNSKTIALTGDSSILIRYHSNAKATMTVTPQDGAAINLDTLVIRNGNDSGYGYSYTFEDVESDVFTFSAMDERGLVGTKTFYADDMVNYIPLTCTMSNSVPDADGDMRLSCFGDFFNDSFGAEYNSLTVQFTYSGSDGSYGDGYMIVSTSGSSYTAYANLSGLNYQTTYTFEITATDELETVTSSESAVKSKPIFHWSENDFVFEVPVTFKKGGFECGTWTPKLNDSSAVLGYVGTPQGWYQKVGNVVTIGWTMKAYINSGQSGKALSIVGIPLSITPAANAFGGGVAHNIYISAGFAFEGWCISSSGISARLQPCNNTTAGNLEISSYSYYPNCSYDGEKTVTLAGTICYMTND